MSESSPQEIPAGGPILQLLAGALQLWVRRQCQAVQSLEIQLQGSALNLLQGRLAGVRLLARGVTYRDLQLELVELNSGALQVQVGHLWRGQPLQLPRAFAITGLVSFTPEGLSRSLAQPAWRWLADQLAEDLLGVTPLVAVEIRRDQLVFKAQGVAQLPAAELETSISAHAGGVRICAGGGTIESLLPLDPTIRVDRAVLEAGMLVLEGQAQVTTSG